MKNLIKVKNELISKFTVEEVSEKIINVLQKFNNITDVPEDYILTEKHLEDIREKVKSLNEEEQVLLYILIETSLLNHIPLLKLALLEVFLKDIVYKDITEKTDMLMKYYEDYIKEGKGLTMYGKIIYDTVKFKMTKSYLILMIYSLVEQTGMTNSDIKECS